ncbi:MAG: potassium transporter KefB [Bacteroidota bacterium]
MTQRTFPAAQQQQPSLLGRRLLIGAGIGFIVISFFVFGVDHPRPEWGQFWMVRPLLVVPFAGACGAFFYHLMDRVRAYGSWQTIVANIASVIVFVVGIWMGIVLGLVGTMWH